MKKSLLLLTLALCHLNSNAQLKPLHSISFSNGTFKGGGINWIMERADSSQFVLFGEQHGVEGVAQFVDFIYTELQNQGFDYLALETDPWTTMKCAALSVDQFTRENPHAIAFDSNGDLQLMQTALELHPNLEHPIWGLDQMQTAIHPFQRLMALAETPEQRRIARGAYLKATLKMGRYTRQHHEKDLQVLEEVFKSNTSPEKELTLKELKQTIEIFTKWINPATRQESVTIREELMKQNLNDYLKHEPESRVVFKMGGAHTIYGVGPNGVLTLGDFAQQTAHRNGKGTLNINVVRYDPENSLVTEQEFEGNNLLLVDTNVFLKFNPEHSSNSSLKGFDAIIYFKGAAYASKSINLTYERKFRNGFISSIIPLAIVLIVCIITIIAFLIRLIRRKKSQSIYPAVASVLAVGLTSFQLSRLLGQGSYSAISTGFFPIAIYLAFGLLSLYFIFQSAQKWKKMKGQKVVKKVSFTIFTISFTMLSYLLYYWNIGGMLN